MDSIIQDIDRIIQGIAIFALPVTLAITLHEAAHGYVAKQYGDLTAYAQGRVTLNPLRHIDPMGTVVVPLLLLAVSSPYLFGWAKPIFNKFSLSRALTFSWLFPNKKYDLNTNTNGEHRAFVVTGSFEEVFPLDIYPMQILKACMYKDLDEMEALGMYEVSPEDFALTEFICVSKQPHQSIIREGLDLMKKEIG